MNTVWCYNRVDGYVMNTVWCSNRVDGVWCYILKFIVCTKFLANKPNLYPGIDIGNLTLKNIIYRTSKSHKDTRRYDGLPYKTKKLCIPWKYYCDWNILPRTPPLVVVVVLHCYLNFSLWKRCILTCHLLFCKMLIKKSFCYPHNYTTLHEYYVHPLFLQIGFIIFFLSFHNWIIV